MGYRRLKWKLKRLIYADEIKEFSKIFAKQIGYEIPWTYFYGEDVWVVVEKGKMLGGFAVISKKVPRCLVQIPAYSYHTMDDIVLIKDKYVKVKHIGELTGFFIRTKRFRLLITFWYFVRSFLKRKKYFLLAYPVEQKGLSKYYASADPFRLYSGPSVQLEGQPEDMEEESVEAITKLGVFKIVWYGFRKSTLKRFINKFKKV